MQQLSIFKISSKTLLFDKTHYVHEVSQIHPPPIRTYPLGFGEMAQGLRALTTLSEVLSSISSNQMVSHNHLINLMESDAFFWGV